MPGQHSRPNIGHPQHGCSISTAAAGFMVTTVRINCWASWLSLKLPTKLARNGGRTGFAPLRLASSKAEQNDRPVP